MCIRDRNVKAVKYGSDETELADLSAKPNFKTLGKKLGPKAVSYTHLRAHETVLELVCRLLLEKKTQPTQKPKSNSINIAQHTQSNYHVTSNYIMNVRVA